MAEEKIRTVGRRRGGRADFHHVDEFLRLVLRLRGNKPFFPKGVFRFESFEESFRWSMKMMARDSNQDHRP